MPASNTVKSQPLSWKYRQASANSASKPPNFSPLRFETSAMPASTARFSRARVSSSISTPSTRMRSLKR
jgi:hypothetical protein